MSSGLRPSTEGARASSCRSRSPVKPHACSAAATAASCSVDTCRCNHIPGHAWPRDTLGSVHDTEGCLSCTAMLTSRPYCHRDINLELGAFNATKSVAVAASSTVPSSAAAAVGFAVPRNNWGTPSAGRLGRPRPHALRGAAAGQATVASRPAEQTAIAAWHRYRNLCQCETPPPTSTCMPTLPAYRTKLQRGRNFST